MRFILFLTAVLFPALALAQVDTTTTSTVGLDELIDAGRGVVEAFGQGPLVGFTALFGALTLVLKWPTAKRVLDGVAEWLRPLLGAVFGGATAVLGAVAMGSVWYAVIIAGVVGVLGGSWFGEFWKQVR